MERNWNLTATEARSALREARSVYAWVLFSQDEGEYIQISKEMARQMLVYKPGDMVTTYRTATDSDGRLDVFIG